MLILILKMFQNSVSQTENVSLSYDYFQQMLKITESIVIILHESPAIQRLEGSSYLWKGFSECS